MIRSKVLRNVCSIIGANTEVTSEQLNRLQDVDDLRLEKGENETWGIYDLELRKYVGKLTII